MLNNLKSLVKKRKRVGRGGDKGGTSGRGHKGQKARSGGSVNPRFEGGQMPLSRRLPKRGFSNKRFSKNFEIVNLGVLNTVFESGSKIDRESLVEKGIIKGRPNTLIKILASGELDKKLEIYADNFSKSAKELILKNDGEAHITRET